MLVTSQPVASAFITFTDTDDDVNVIGNVHAYDQIPRIPYQRHQKSKKKKHEGKVPNTTRAESEPGEQSSFPVRRQTG